MDLAQRLLDEAQVVHLQSDDVLLIGNVGHDIEPAGDALRDLDEKGQA